MSTATARQAADVRSWQNYIDGAFVDAAEGKTFEVVDPARVEVIARVAEAGRADTERAVAAARRAFDDGSWSSMPVKERVAVLREIARRLRDRSDELFVLESRQSGIPLRKTTLMDIPVGIEFFERTLDLAEKFEWYEPLPWMDFPAVSWNFVAREPIGVCAGINAWNFPFLFTMWKAAPALAMGNTLVLKPASYTPLSTLVFAEVAHEVGLPPGVLNIVAGPGGSVGATLARSPQVDKIAFTGSTAVGAQILGFAGTNIKKTTLELGGKSANIVLDDADLNLAVDGALFAAFWNQGQACEAGTRLLLDASIHDEFLERLLERAKLMNVGDPLEFDTTVGPLISAQQLATVESYVKGALEEGATCLLGGGRAKVAGLPDGYFHEPTVFTGVRPDSRLFQEEVFGPVLAVTKFDSIEEAVRLANDSAYGLAGAVWTSDRARGIEVARALRTGTVWINDYHLLSPLAPFGGYRQSGNGREHGTYGLKEYTEIKHIHVDQIGPDSDKRFWFDYTLNR